MFRRIWLALVATLVLLASSSVAATLPTKVEVWHPMSRALDLCAKKALKETPGALAWYSVAPRFSFNR